MMSQHGAAHVKIMHHQSSVIANSAAYLQRLFSKWSPLQCEPKFTIVICRLLICQHTGCVYDHFFSCHDVSYPFVSLDTCHAKQTLCTGKIPLLYQRSQSPLWLRFHCQSRTVMHASHIPANDSISQHKCPC